ncbi:MAG TPA: hypothetical protein GX717_09125 [Clostridiaceae bacterium]|nr:hypothetical protein [Clostridiaceae bacterium]
MVWQNPKLDWIPNPHNPVKDDFNRIEGNIDFLKTDIETKKGSIVNALNAVGVSAALTDTHTQLAGKITGAKKTGIVLTPGTADVAIPKGIYDTGGGKVAGDPDLIANNIKIGKNIFGVAGNVVPDFLDEDWYAKVPMSNYNSPGSYTYPYTILSVTGKGFAIADIATSYTDDAIQIEIDGEIILGSIFLRRMKSQFLLWRFNNSLVVSAPYSSSPGRLVIYCLDS